jgi:hypothetical protein
MDGPLIQIPTAADLPPDLRPSPGLRLRPEVPDIDRAAVPQAEGWHLIVLPVRPPRATESGFALAPDTVRHLDIMRTIGVVLSVGDLAWSEHRKWPADYRDKKLGALKASQAAIGEAWVLFHAAAGLDIRMQSRDQSEMVGLKVIDDASVLAVFASAAALSAFLVLI